MGPASHRKPSSRPRLDTGAGVSGDAELAEDAASVTFHRVEGDVELRADLLLRQFGSQQAQIFASSRSLRSGSAADADRRIVVSCSARSVLSRSSASVPGSGSSSAPASLTRGRARLVIVRGAWASAAPGAMKACSRPPAADRRGGQAPQPARTGAGCGEITVQLEQPAPRQYRRRRGRRLVNAALGDVTLGICHYGSRVIDITLIETGQRELPKPLA